MHAIFDCLVMPKQTGNFVFFSSFTIQQGQRRQFSSNSKLSLAMRALPMLLLHPSFPSPSTSPPFTTHSSASLPPPPPHHSITCQSSTSSRGRVERVDIGLGDQPRLESNVQTSRKSASSSTAPLATAPLAAAPPRLRFPSCASSYSCSSAFSWCHGCSCCCSSCCDARGKINEEQQDNKEEEDKIEQYK